MTRTTLAVRLALVGFLHLPTYARAAAIRYCGGFEIVVLPDKARQRVKFAGKRVEVAF